MNDPLPINKPPDNPSILNDPVNHPAHYTSHPSGVECITITRHCNFNIGNAIKYLWRVDGKNTPIENLRKSLWYIQDEIGRLEALESQRDPKV